MEHMCNEVVLGCVHYEGTESATLSVNHLLQTMFLVLYVVYLVSSLTDYVLCIVLYVDYVLCIVCCVLSVSHLLQTMFFVLYVVY